MHVYTDYQGHRIRLTDERLAHILEHPEMRGMEPRIGETLSTPQRVVESLSDLQARLYYRFYTLEVLFDQREGVFRETSNDQVMEKVDAQGNILGFSVLKVSALATSPLEMML